MTLTDGAPALGLTDDIPPAPEEPGSGEPGPVPASRTRARWTGIGLVRLLMATLVALVAVGAGAAVLSRVQIASSVDSLRTQWVPARGVSAALRQGFTDQAAGELGYLLTGADTFLGRYETGRRHAARARNRLANLLPHDATVRPLLDALDRAADNWRTVAVEPQIAARRSGPLRSPVLLSDVAATAALYDMVRVRLSALDAYLQRREADQLADVEHQQSLANVVTVIVVVITVLVAAAGVVVVRRMLLRPAAVLLRDVNIIASGSHRHPISRAGPREFETVADAVDDMRVSILRHAEELAETRRRLARAEEQERLAADLHDHTVQRLFGVGLGLTAAAARFPEAAGTLRGLVDETDDILRELRGLILGLRRDRLIADLGTHVRNIAHESARSLGFAPEVMLAGPMDRVPPTIGLEMISVAREALSNVARHASAQHATVAVEVEQDALRLRVSDDGVGLAGDGDGSGYGLTNIRARADKLGGVATISGRPGGGTTVDWRVPLPDDEAPPG